MPPATEQLVPAVDRAARMLSSLRDHDAGKGISDLARDLDIPKSSAFQIASTLVHHGYLERDDRTRRYRLGAALGRLAGERRVRADLPALAAPRLRDLATETGLTALLGLPVDAGTLLAARGDSPEPLGISAPIGFCLDGHAGAFGKVFAAAIGGPRAARSVRDLPAFTARSITDPEAFRRELDRVRKRGFATDFEEYLDGVHAIAAPVRDRDDTVVAAVCVLGIAAKLKRARVPAVAPVVCGVAADLSEDLGHAGGDGDCQ